MTTLISSYQPTILREIPHMSNRQRLHIVFNKIIQHEVDTFLPEDYELILKYEQKLWTKIFWSYMRKKYISLYWSNAHSQDFFDYCHRMNLYVRNVAKITQFMVDQSRTVNYGNTIPLMSIPDVPEVPYFLR